MTVLARQALHSASLAAPDPTQGTGLDQIITQMNLNSGELWEGASVMGHEEVLLALLELGSPGDSHCHCKPTLCNPASLCPSR